ncbi:hypothetical protein K461DRAFT_289931 [Myriangium duriaei CBS 260.36]|uniref:DUF2282 domain-containing protein n=1 Tax=Myriangium duriaei CBS 260.36 TaxID=1168546 RepID=A0A9P4MSK7_9PEZI|nr:hypothetical protein K461DRAFT_289931 [Myriangium duriaei CBS 260.36]
MLPKSALLCATALIFAGQTVAFSIPQDVSLDRRQTTGDPYIACLDHQEGDACTFGIGVIHKGVCVNVPQAGNVLYCAQTG